MDDLSEFFSDALGASIGFSDEKEIRTNSIRLKSALKQWEDYMKNRSTKRSADYLISEFEATILPDSTVLLGSIWDICVTPSNSAFHNWIHSSFPSFNHEHRDAFKAEMQMLLGGGVSGDLEDLYTMVDRLREFAPNLLSVASFFIFCVSLNCNTSESLVEATWPIKIVSDVVWSKYSSDFSVGVYDNLAIFRHQMKLFLVHRDHLVNICDKINERLNVIVFSLLKPPSVNRCVVPTPLFLWLFKWGDEIIAKYQSEGFLILSNYEAIIVGLILRQGDEEMWEVHDFLNSVVEDIESEMPDSRDQVMTLLDHLYHLTPDQLSDIHGMYRIWGHPEVRLKEGLKKMMENSLTQKNPDEENLLWSKYTFREMFCTSYFKKHRHYPLITISWTDDEEDQICPYVINQLRQGKFIDRNFSRYDLQDWRYVTLGQNFQIPVTWNLAHNIKDKAISPDRDELHQSIKRGMGVIIQEYRRTVLKWLKRDMVPMRAFLSAVDATGLPKNSCIIGLYAKERELKLLPRFFSLMSFEMRLYFVATEQLLSDNLLPYFPQITMTTNLLEMTKKIMKMSSQLQDDGGDINNSVKSSKGKSVSYAINIDFKKWNQQMRERVTRDVFSEIDKLFGMKRCYSRTHEILGSSMIYLCSGEHVPQMSGDYVIEEKPWNWSGDESGKEGLRQKGWTVMTVAMIEYIMRSHDVKYELIGGGDNQVLVVTLSTTLTNSDGSLTSEGKLETKNRMKKVVESLDRYFSSVGLPLKLNETWVSSELFMYNKLMCHRGLMLRNVSKTVSRTFPFSDDAAITVSGMTSAMGTSLKSIPSKDFGHLSTYKFSRWLSLWLSFIIFHAHPLLEAGCSKIAGVGYCYSIQGSKILDTCPSSSVNMSSLLGSLLFHHRVMGGISLGVPADWVMRGFPDPLTSALAWNKGLMKRMWTRGQLFRQIKATVSVSKKAGPMNLLHLVSDPVAINHDAPVSGLAALREISEKAIITSPEITNTSFRELASLCHSDASREFIESMTSSSVLEPRYLHDIFGATLYGYFNSIVSRVDKSMTIVRLNRKSRVMNRIKEKEVEFMAYLLDRWRRDFDYCGDILQCSRELADLYRKTTWQKTIVGVTVPSPLECFSGFSEHIYEKCDENFIVLSTLHHNIHERVMGPLEPYLGSYTDEKFKLSPIAGAFGEEELLSKSIHLQKLRHWRYNEGTDLYNLVRGVLISETDLDPDSLFVFLESGSSSTHRYADEVLQHGAILNTIPDLYRWYSMSSTTLSKRCKGGRNDMIHFQASFLWVTSVIMNRELWNLQNPPTVHFHETCPSCITEVVEVNDEDIKLNIPWNLPRIKDNSVAYVYASSITPSYANTVLIEKFQKSVHLTVDVPENEEKILTTDAIAQGLYLVSTGKKNISQSNINSMGETRYIREIFRKYSALTRAHHEYYGKPLKHSRLSALVSCQSFCKLLFEDQVHLLGVELHQRRKEGTEKMISLILEKLIPKYPKYLTTLEIDPKFFVYCQVKTRDKSLSFCNSCNDSLMTNLSSVITSNPDKYGCSAHISKPLPRVLMHIVDAYGLSKTIRGTLSRGNHQLSTIQSLTERYWNSVVSSLEEDPEWVVMGISSVSEYLATKELYGTFMALYEAVSHAKRAGMMIDLIVDGDWSYAILGIVISKYLSVDCKVSSNLNVNSTTGSEYCGMVGLRSFLYEEDKACVRLEQPGDDLVSEVNYYRVQIVTGKSGKIFDSHILIFPLTSNEAVRKIKMSLDASPHMIWYPKYPVDRAVWCMAIKTLTRRDSLHSLYVIREDLKRSRIDSRKRTEIEKILESFRYPILMTQGLLYVLPDLGKFVEPKHKIDMITNAQILYRELLESKTRRSILLKGEDKLNCYLFLSLMSLTMGTVNGRLLIQKTHEIRFYADSGRLNIRRKRSDNNLLLSIMEVMGDHMTVGRIHYEITGKDNIFLIQSGEKGVHVYPMLY